GLTAEFRHVGNFHVAQDRAAAFGVPEFFFGHPLGDILEQQQVVARRVWTLVGIGWVEARRISLHWDVHEDWPGQEKPRDQCGPGLALTGTVRWWFGRIRTAHRSVAVACRRPGPRT